MYNRDFCATIPRKNTNHISNSKRYINVQDIQLWHQPEAVDPLIKIIEANVLHNSITAFNSLFFL